MKKTVFLIAALLFGGALTSCNKNYTCRCQDHQGKKTDYPFTTTSRQKAKDYCENYNFPNGNCDLIR